MRTAAAAAAAAAAFLVSAAAAAPITALGASGVFADAAAERVLADFDRRPLLQLAATHPCCPAAAADAAAERVLADFTGNATLRWQVTNDPVMGGQSYSSWKMASDPKFGAIGVFSGDNKIVPSLKAPGFCNARGQFAGSVDLSDFGYTPGDAGSTAFKMVARTSTPDYQGFKFAFGGQGVPKTSIFGGGSFKAGFNMTGTLFQEVTIPLGDFSYDWSGFTGGCNTKDPARGLFQQHYCCPASGLSPSKPSVCPAPAYLTKIDDIELWAEGTAGNFDLEVVKISIVRSD